MRIDVRACAEGKTVDFTDGMSLSELDFFGVKPFCEPVSVRGAISRRAGVAYFSAVASTVLHLLCDRCAEPFLRPLSIKVDAVLAEELENPELEEQSDIIVLQDGICDTSAILEPNLILEIGMKNLCSDRCKGICPGCGLNLNNESCRCPERETDPRLAKLKEFFAE